MNSRVVKQGSFFLVDSHAHLCDTVFDHDRKEVLDRAVAKGVTHVVAVAETLEDGEKNLALARCFAAVLPAAGLFPTCLEPARAEAVLAFITAHQPELACIGEVGLDFWKVQGEAEREIQRHIFSLFIAAAQTHKLPLSIHSRSAGRSAVAMVLEQGGAPAVFHAFDGKYATALPAVEAGCHFSIPPSLLRSRQKEKLVRNLPLSSLLIESDAPVLGPSPDRRNEPANCVLVIEAIAAIKGIAPQEVAEAVRENTRSVFGNRLPVL